MPAVGMDSPVGAAHAAEIANSPVHPLEFRLPALAFGAQNIAVARFERHQFGDDSLQLVLAAVPFVGWPGGTARFTGAVDCFAKLRLALLLLGNIFPVVV